MPEGRGGMGARLREPRLTLPDGPAATTTGVVFRLFFSHFLFPVV